MSKFKGTKGKWEVQGTSWLDEDAAENHVEFNIRNDEGVISAQCAAYSFFGIKSIEEAKANAQLIATAPEMMDFINRISGEMLRNHFVLDERWYDQAQELISKITQS